MGITSRCGDTKINRSARTEWRRRRLSVNINHASQQQSSDGKSRVFTGDSTGVSPGHLQQHPGHIWASLRGAPASCNPVPAERGAAAIGRGALAPGLQQAAKRATADGSRRSKWGVACLNRASQVRDLLGTPFLFSGSFGRLLCLFAACIDKCLTHNTVRLGMKSSLCYYPSITLLL